VRAGGTHVTTVITVILSLVFQRAFTRGIVITGVEK
jgi:ABC-type glycerol-3-phosphate transport system permease component